MGPLKNEPRNAPVCNKDVLSQQFCTQILKFGQLLTFQDLRAKLNNETVSSSLLRYYRTGISLSITDITLTCRNIN
jgi:hypothetical protein